MDSSYVYVVKNDGTMLYHPTKEKVGQPVENASFGGKHICSIAIACSTSSGFILLNSKLSVIILYLILLFIIY
jgi:sensor histidine kinase regulating citrate/malate metabolism